MKDICHDDVRALTNVGRPAHVAGRQTQDNSE